MHLVGFTIETYYDARPYERQKPTDFVRENWSSLLGLLKYVTCVKYETIKSK